MFGWFAQKTFRDERLGEFSRRRGGWRGSVRFDGQPAVPLVLAGGRDAPDEAALVVAREVETAYAQRREVIAAALFEHWEPYGASASGD